MISPRAASSRSLNQLLRASDAVTCFIPTMYNCVARTVNGTGVPEVLRRLKATAARISATWGFMGLIDRTFNKAVCPRLPINLSYTRHAHTGFSFEKLGL